MKLKKKYFIYIYIKKSTLFFLFISQIYHFIFQKLVYTYQGLVVICEPLLSSELRIYISRFYIFNMIKPLNFCNNNNLILKIMYSFFFVDSRDYVFLWTLVVIFFTRWEKNIMSFSLYNLSILNCFRTQRKANI